MNESEPKSTVYGIGPIGRNVARNIRRFREGQGMTMKRFAELLKEAGRTGDVVSVRRVETLGRRVDVDDLVVIGRILNVEPADLMAEAPPCRSCNDAPPPGFTCNNCGSTSG